jgi:hypothetical protein
MRNPIEICFYMSPGGTPLSSGALTRAYGWLSKPRDAQAETWIVKLGHASGGILPFGMAWMYLPRSRRKRMTSVRFGRGQIWDRDVGVNPIREFYIREIPEWIPRTGVLE